MSLSKIEWTDRTWNPVIGCTRVSAGCENCYAERQVHRGMQPAHRGLTFEGKHGPRWNGDVRFLPERLEQPLHWKKPARIFVNSLSDLFHESLTDEQIDQICAVMALAPRHTFQVLTKRPARMLKYLASDPRDAINGEAGILEHYDAMPSVEWPLPNVWLGVSVEDQATADERIPLLLQTPAAKRFVSYEPALGPVDFEQSVLLNDSHDVRGTAYECQKCRRRRMIPRPLVDRTPCECGAGAGYWCGSFTSLDWVICGGESGPGARPFDIAWARSTVEQCEAAGVACFVKQLGARPFSVADRISHRGYDRSLGPAPHGFSRYLNDRKGGDPAEWPEDLRVREFPDG